MVYCVDPDKRQHWHIDLCTMLQEALRLPEPPHFLTPYYSVTLDCGTDSSHHDRRILAEAYPATFRYRYFLNAFFQISDVIWKCLTCTEGLCDPLVLSGYRQQFPQLWQKHDLILRLNQISYADHPKHSGHKNKYQPYSLHPNVQLSRYGSLSETLENCRNHRQPSGYVFRLFVSGHGAKTVQILQRLHKLLEEELEAPYTLKVIDIVKHPEQAEQNQITAIPTLVRVWPEPIHRLVGYFDSKAQLSQVLHLSRATIDYN